MELSDFKVLVLSDGFSTALDRTELASIASTNSGGAYREQALSYYDAAVSAKSFTEQLTAVRLLKESFESDFADAENVQWKDYHQQLVDYHQRLLADFKQDKSAAKGLVNAELTNASSPAEAASLVCIARAVLNADNFITRE